jgi:hypothetical protein
MKKLLSILILGLIVSGPAALTTAYAGGHHQNSQGQNDDCQGDEDYLCR